MIFNTSASDLDESSNPGVSMRRTIVSATLNGFEYAMLAVQDSRSSPTTRFESEAILMNCDIVGKFVYIREGIDPHRRFPDSSAPHDSVRGRQYRQGRSRVHELSKRTTRTLSGPRKGSVARYSAFLNSFASVDGGRGTDMEPSLLLILFYSRSFGSRIPMPRSRVEP